MKDDDADSDRSDSGLLCSWCGKSFSPESTDQAEVFVCPQCVRLLIGAGFSHEEIYRPRPSKKPDSD